MRRWCDGGRVRTVGVTDRCSVENHRVASGPSVTHHPVPRGRVTVFRQVVEASAHGRLKLSHETLSRIPFEPIDCRRCQDTRSLILDFVGGMTGSDKMDRNLIADVMADSTGMT